MLVLFVAKQLGILALLLLAASGGGTLLLGPRDGIAFRSAVGLAVCAHALFFLALAGLLRPLPLLALALVAILGGAWLARPSLPPALLWFLPLFALALFPPVAFDETLYHLPFVRAFARDGALRFLPEVRFPVFPVLHELLCVPPSLLAGDVATHVVAFAEMVITAGLLVQWARERGARSPWLAAAIFLGSPIVIQLGSVLYVECALMLFVAAGFYALDRERPALAGLLLGTACGVKYLGGYFVLAALVIAIARRTKPVIFAVAAALAALPTTLWIALQSGSPVFPFYSANPWTHAPAAQTDHAMRIVRVLFDVTFARDRLNHQPPFTPFLALLVVLILAAALRDVRARWLAAVCAGYVVVFAFLIQDSRYLTPLLPLVSAAAAIIIGTRWPRAATVVALLAVAPGVAYAGYRLMQLGVPPSTIAQREAWLAERVPEYRAVRRAGSERVYVCGGEQLKAHAAGELLGDLVGPYSYDRVVVGAAGTSELARRLRRIGVRDYLVAKRTCAPPNADGGMTLVYEDEAAQLWRVEPRT